MIDTTGKGEQDQLTISSMMTKGTSIAAPPTSGIGKRRSAAREDSSVSHQGRRKEIGEAAIRVFNRLGFRPAEGGVSAEEVGKIYAGMVRAGLESTYSR